jgi:RNA polymerase sigma-70 factor (ECF subfamily)
VVGRPLESDLIERARAGDAAAYGDLVREHQQLAFRTAWLVTGSAADAEDAVQEAFIKAWRALPRFRAGAPFRPWILAIVANEARSRRRELGRRSELAVRAAAQQRRSGDAAPSPEAVLLAGETSSELLRGLHALTARDREVIVLRHVLDLSEADTAAALRCRRGTVKSRLSRAMTRLREELETQE